MKITKLTQEESRIISIMRCGSEHSKTGIVYLRKDYRGCALRYENKDEQMPVSLNVHAKLLKLGIIEESGRDRYTLTDLGKSIEI